MDLKNGLVYIQFHPLSYMIKLRIEMSMATLILRLARRDSTNGRQRFSMYCPTCRGRNLGDASPMPQSNSDITMSPSRKPYADSGANSSTNPSKGDDAAKKHSQGHHILYGSDLDMSHGHRHEHADGEVLNARSTAPVHDGEWPLTNYPVTTPLSNHKPIAESQVPAQFV